MNFTDDMKKKMSDMKDVCEAEDMSPEEKMKKLYDLLGVDMDEEEEVEKDDEEKSDEKKESVKHNTNNNKINAKLLLEAAGLNSDDDLVKDLEKLDVESASKMVRRLAESKFKAATKNFIPSKQDNKMSSNDLARFLLS